MSVNIELELTEKHAKLLQKLVSLEMALGVIVMLEIIEVKADQA